MFQAPSNRRRRVTSTDISTPVPPNPAFVPVGDYVIVLAQDPAQRDALVSMLNAATALDGGSGGLGPYLFRRLLESNCEAALLDALPESAALESHLRALIEQKEQLNGQTLGTRGSNRPVSSDGAQHVQLLAILYERRSDWATAVRVLLDTALRRWSVGPQEGRHGCGSQRLALMQKALELVRFSCCHTPAKVWAWC
jgi:hypothetical protein